MSQRCNRRGSYMQLAGPVARPDAVRMTMAVPVSGVGLPTINNLQFSLPAAIGQSHAAICPDKHFYSGRGSGNRLLARANFF